MSEATTMDLSRHYTQMALDYSLVLAENRQLRKDLDKLKDAKTEDIMADVKRSILEDLEKMDAEELKAWILDIFTRAITGEEK